MDGNVTENGIKADTSYEKVAKLNPAFIKPHGANCMLVIACDDFVCPSVICINVQICALLIWFV